MLQVSNPRTMNSRCPNWFLLPPQREERHTHVCSQSLQHPAAHSHSSTPLLTSDIFRFVQTLSFSFKYVTSHSLANRRQHASKKSHAACPREGDPIIHQPNHMFSHVPGLHRYLHEWLCPGCRSILPQMGLTAVSLSYLNCILA